MIHLFISFESRHFPSMPDLFLVSPTHHVFNLCQHVLSPALDDAVEGMFGFQRRKGPIPDERSLITASVKERHV